MFTLKRVDLVSTSYSVMSLLEEISRKPGFNVPETTNEGQREEQGVQLACQIGHPEFVEDVSNAMNSTFF